MLFDGLYNLIDTKNTQGKVRVKYFLYLHVVLEKTASGVPGRRLHNFFFVVCSSGNRAFT